MNATGVWFGNKAWPSGSSPGAFARDVFRLENCKTDREKALAFDKWLLRCMNRGPNLYLPGLGGYIPSADPLLTFTSWCSHECTGWGWIATEALQAAGMKARRAVAFNSGHTFYEVWYKGVDGKEGWHAFDPFSGWYFLNDQGEVASCEELAANPDLVTRPRTGGRDRFGHFVDRGSELHRYRVHDLLDVVQPVRNEELRYEPQVGMQFSNLWRPEHPSLAIPAGKAGGGSHCSIPAYDEKGRPTYPEHLPYWKNYMWSTPADTAVDGGISGRAEVRWHGCGALRWEPLLWGEKVAWRAHNAIFEDGTVRPTGAKKHCEVWWHIKLPYMASYLRANLVPDVGGGDLVGLAVSPDAGRSVQPIYWKTGKPPRMITLSPSETPSLRGLREFWLRLDLSTQSVASPLRVRALRFHIGYQLNMNLLPRLVPGENELYLQADEVNDTRLVAEWAYTHPTGERLDVIELGEKGTQSQVVNPEIERPDELIMRGVTLTCQPR